MSIYEDRLEAGRRVWQLEANARWQLLHEIITLFHEGKLSRSEAHVYMENYMTAVETVLSYEKALGRAPCPTSILPKP